MNWLHISDTHDFSVHNLPYGVFDRDGRPTPGVAIGDFIIDLRACMNRGILTQLELPSQVFESDTLNEFIALGKPTWSAMRKWLQGELNTADSSLYQNQKEILVNRLTSKMYLPVQIGDYTDFYSSIEHATNVGIMFRDPANALLPNWKHLPVGYHGRASSIVISDTDVIRPKGQTLPPGAETPVFGPTKRLDFELEMAFVVGRENKLGQSIKVDDAEDFIFGMVVFNDWSARDIQKWEYVPLGPFLAKSFASTISPWIVTMDALAPFKSDKIPQDPEVLPYLQSDKTSNYDIKLEVVLDTADGSSTVLSKSNFKYMYWNMAQQLAHHTVNGCNVRVGDMMASGTISGKDPNSYGSMLELSWSGKNPILLSNGETRTFIDDGDVVSMKANCENGIIGIGFGEARGKIVPALD